MEFRIYDLNIIWNLEIGICNFHFMLNKKITIIGAGNMGPAIARGLTINKLMDASHITLCDPDADRLRELIRELGVEAYTDNSEGSENADIIILAVKPNLIKAVCEELKSSLKKQVILSVAAGITISSIQKWLGKKKHPIVRVMPNTPSQIGVGMSGWTTTSEVTERQKQTVMQILQALGDEVYFETEEAIDLVTALSGSGPAYFFYFVEVLARAGEKLGLSKKQAEHLARQTAYGAIELLKRSEKTPQNLREEVTSKGGTTEAALNVMKKEGLEDIIEKALQTAVKKAKQISKG